MIVFTAGEFRALPKLSWKRNVSKNGDSLYCLDRLDSSLMFESNLGSLAKVIMIGSEVRKLALISQNFEIKYSADGSAWNNFTQGWNLTVR